MILAQLGQNTLVLVPEIGIQLQAIHLEII